MGRLAPLILQSFIKRRDYSTIRVRMIAAAEVEGRRMTRMSKQGPGKERRGKGAQHERGEGPHFTPPRVRPKRAAYYFPEIT